MLSNIVEEIVGGHDVKLGDGQVVSFRRPFARVSMMTALHNATGTNLPEDLASEESRQTLEASRHLLWQRSRLDQSWLCIHE